MYRGLTGVKAVNGGVNANGTCLQGYLTATFDEIAETLAAPPITGGSADGKVQVEWKVLFVDGTVATIYDWKTNLPAEEVTRWNIGGNSVGAGAVAWLAEIFTHVERT